LFGKTRCEREGCDIGAIETGQQVFKPSEWYLKAHPGSQKNGPEGEKGREREIPLEGIDR
jgi:hypothetical protein